MPALVLAIALLFLQTPKASIEGLVLRDGSNEPIAGIRVTLYPFVPNPTPLGTVTTDSAGRFAFTGLAAGDYSVSADTNGYALEYWLAEVSGSIPGKRVALKDGEGVKDLRFQLIPEGIISGRVLGTAGEPLVDVELQLVIGQYRPSGRKSYANYAAVRTNDRGEYRFYGLRPGHFYLRAAAPLITASGTAEPRARGVGDEVGTKYTATFFPNAISVLEASIVEVKAGIALDKMDFVMRERPTARFRIEGRMVDSRGPLPPNGIQYTFYSLPGEGRTGFTMSRTAPDGTFEIADIDPGTWLIEASIQAPAGPPPQPGQPRPVAMFPTLYAYATVIVAASDVSGVFLTLNPVSLSGRLQVDQGQLPPGLQVRLNKVVPGNSPAPAVVAPDGSFSFVNVSPGADYDLAFNGLLPDMYLKAATFGPADLRYQRLRVADGPQSPILIEIGTDGGSLDGAASAGARIALVPTDRVRRDLYRFATAGADGKYSLRGIVPGDYKLFTFASDAEPYAAFDPAFLATHEQKGIDVGVESPQR
jgi:protocatechuate 3,4-dioxygenase beta subunit